MSAVGFNVGYQTSLVAAPKQGGIETLCNEYSSRATPTVVSFGEKQRFCGETARLKMVTNFKNTITGFIELLGLNFSDPLVQARKASAPFEIVEMPDGTVGYAITYLGEAKTVSCVQVTAVFLSYLRGVAEAALKTKTSDCVIGVPVAFNDRQRHAMLAAAQTAGLNVLRLMNETAATALAYGIYKQDLPEKKEEARRVVFCDVGHSVMQMSCAELIKGKLTILAAEQTDIGGIHFDQALYTHFAAEIKDKYKVDCVGKVRPTLRLMNECEKMKKLMSANTQQLPMNIECFMDDKDVQLKIERAQMDEMTTAVLEKAKGCVDRLLAKLKELKIKLSDIYAVEVVGGASRIKSIQALLETSFEKPLSTTLNTDEAVARGCALQAAISSPTFRVRDFAVIDKTPYGIMLCWEGSGDEEESANSLEVFSPGSESRISKILTFYRDSDFELTAKYIEPSPGPANIGNFKVVGAKPSFDGKTQKIKVKLKLDENGIFVVESASMVDKLQPTEETPEDSKKESASEKKDSKEDKKEETEDKKEKAEDKKEEEPKKKVKTHRTVTLNVVAEKPVLSSKAIEDLKEEELKMAAADKQEIDRANAKNSLEEYVYETRDKLAGPFEKFIKESELETFRAKLTETEDWLYDEGEEETRAVYAKRLEELKAIGDPVAKRAAEAETRPDAIQELQKTLVTLRKFVTKFDEGAEEYNHIDKADVDKVRSKLEEKENWLNGLSAKQAALLPYEDPVLSTLEVSTANATLNFECNPIVTKPKPKVEPPKEEAKPADGEAAEKTGAEAAADTPTEGATTSETPSAGEGPTAMDLD